MTVNEYRQKHKRCKYCEYYSSKSILGIRYSQPFTWCSAKKKETKEEAEKALKEKLK